MRLTGLATNESGADLTLRAARRLQRNARRGFGRPWIDPVTGFHNRVFITPEHFPELHQIERMPLRAHRRQIFFREPKQPDRRSQAPPMFRMRRMFELFLQMNKGAGGLDQSFEILRIFGCRRPLEPDLLENIVRLIVTLRVPATKKRAIIRMIGDRVAAGFRLATFQRLHELGNSLAFAHGGRNLVAPAMMGKRARFSLREDTWHRLPACGSSQPRWLCHD
jgi:hypothetical protein